MERAAIYAVTVETSCELTGKLRDELLNVEMFDRLIKAGVLTEHRRVPRPPAVQSDLGYRPPAPKAIATTT